MDGISKALFLPLKVVWCILFTWKTNIIYLWFSSTSLLFYLIRFSMLNIIYHYTENTLFNSKYKHKNLPFN